MFIYILYKAICNISSSFKHYVHILSLNGIAAGFCHILVSAFNMLNDILILEIDILSLSNVIPVKLGWSLKL